MALIEREEETTMAELKSCPFCGGSNITIITMLYGVEIKCFNCGANVSDTKDNGEYRKQSKHGTGGLTMAEYIEREAVEKMLDDAGIISDGEYNGYCTEDVNIKDIPAADVAEVRHGRWVETRIIRYDGSKPYTQFVHSCSLCKYLNKRKKGWNTKYCPNCGAKMDGEG